MSRIRFVGGESAPDNIKILGIDFVRGEWLELEVIPAKLFGHREFEIEGATAPAPAKQTRRAKHKETVK